MKKVIQAVQKGEGSNYYGYLDGKVFDMKLTKLGWEMREDRMRMCKEFCRDYSGIPVKIVHEVLDY